MHFYLDNLSIHIYLDISQHWGRRFLYTHFRIYELHFFFFSNRHYSRIGIEYITTFQPYITGVVFIRSPPPQDKHSTLSIFSNTIPRPFPGIHKMADGSCRDEGRPSKLSKTLLLRVPYPSAYRTSAVFTALWNLLMAALNSGAVNESNYLPRSSVQDV